MRVIIKLIQYIQLTWVIRAIEKELLHYCFLSFSLEQSMYQDEKWTHEDLPHIYEELANYQAQIKELEDMLSLFMDRRFFIFESKDKQSNPLTIN